MANSQRSGARAALASLMLSCIAVACSEPATTAPLSPTDSSSDRVETTAPATIASAGTVPTTCSGYPHDRVVRISTSKGLTWALQNARPGDLIQLGDARYVGHFNSSKAGTPGHRIVLCGSRNAVIDGNSLSTGGFALTIRGSYWVLDGFTVRNTHQGVRFEGSSYSTARRLAIFDVGQEAINIRKFAKHDTLDANRIYNTGRRTPEYGEGIYIGSFNGHWCGLTGCQPDRSDNVVVRNNVIGPNVAAEAIDVKEGTTGGLIEGNTFDGRGMIMSQTWVDSWVELKGNGYRVVNNRGTYSLRDGFQAFRQISGWGNNNTFSGNTGDVQASGYGFRISNVSGTSIGCDNVITNARSGTTNLACR